MQQFALIFFESPEGFSARTDPARQEEHMGLWQAYVAAIAEAGVQRGGSGLMPPETGATLRNRSGTPEVLDGPYAETKEQLGGFIILEVEDMQAALAWAARAPCARYGAVEVRPAMPRTCP